MKTPDRIRKLDADLAGGHREPAILALLSLKQLTQLRTARALRERKHCARNLP